MTKQLETRHQNVCVIVWRLGSSGVCCARVKFYCKKGGDGQYAGVPHYNGDWGLDHENNLKVLRVLAHVLYFLVTRTLMNPIYQGINTVQVLEPSFLGL